MFNFATRRQITALVDTYPYKNGSAGSPFGTGNLNKEYPEYKRLAAILGDMEFTLMRRAFLETIPSGVPAWSFLATWGREVPIVGTFHTSDLPRAFYDGDDTSLAMQDRYIAFVNSMDPNAGVASLPAGFRTFWPKWQKHRQLLEFGADSTGILVDDFRTANFDFIMSHLKALRF
jgi:carboxylesterase type B